MSQRAILQKQIDDLVAEREQILRTAHWECDCVPNRGPSHCHACSDIAGREVAWADAIHRGPTYIK